MSAVRLAVAGAGGRMGRALLEAGSADPATAIAAPRWRVDPGTWWLHLESRYPDAIPSGLQARGHRTAPAPAFDSAMGHAHAIRIGPDGFHAGSDPRAEGAARGL